MTFMISFGVFVASFLGSLHCVAMCGPFLMTTVSSRRNQVEYHLGRLLGYVSLGALAGAFGKIIFETVQIRLLQMASSWILIFIFLWMSTLIWQNKSLSISILPKNWIQKILKTPSSFVFGMASVFLPCGWLYSFVIGAIATGNPLAGAIYLFAFWLGTVPALVMTSFLFKHALEPLRHYAPKIAAILFFILGITAILQKELIR